MQLDAFNVEAQMTPSTLESNRAEHVIDLLQLIFFVPYRSPTHGHPFGIPQDIPT